MPLQQTQPRWISRTDEIERAYDDVAFPDLEGLDQDEEWCEVTRAGRRRRIRFHDYDEIYKIPGLYEGLFYGKLKCCSPSRVVGLLASVMDERGEDPATLRVLDVGAGNGMVGDELDVHGAELLVGVDIVPEARMATDRDRPGLYADYEITDLADLPEQVEEKLRRHRLNCMTTVAALGYGDIPTAAFLKALDLISAPGWVAFNIKEDFLHESDQTGFCGTIQQLARERVLRIEAYRRYRHRLNIAGEPLHYVAVAARKLVDLPDHLAGGDQA